MELSQSNPKAIQWITNERKKLEADRDLLKVDRCHQLIITYGNSTNYKQV
jgi:hypothetical protein